MSENYKISIPCKNCKKTTWLGIPRGILVKDHLESNKIKCENCGCNLE